MPGSYSDITKKHKLSLFPSSSSIMQSSKPASATTVSPHLPSASNQIFPLQLLTFLQVLIPHQAQGSGLHTGLSASRPGPSKPSSIEWLSHSAVLQVTPSSEESLGHLPDPTRPSSPDPSPLLQIHLTLTVLIPIFPMYPLGSSSQISCYLSPLSLCSSLEQSFLFPAYRPLILLGQAQGLLLQEMDSEPLSSGHGPPLHFPLGS